MSSVTIELSSMDKLFQGAYVNTKCVKRSLSFLKFWSSGQPVWKIQTYAVDLNTVAMMIVERIRLE